MKIKTNARLLLLVGALKGLTAVAAFGSSPPMVSAITIQGLDADWGNPQPLGLSTGVGQKVRITSTATDPDGALQVHNILVNRPTLMGETTRLTSTTNPFFDALPLWDPNYRPSSDPVTIDDKSNDVFNHPIANYQSTDLAGWTHFDLDSSSKS